MTNIRHEILSSRIPESSGRQITPSERRRLLRKSGISVSVKSRVVRAFGCDYIGSLYAPRAGGLTDLGISVTTLPGA